MNIHRIIGPILTIAFRASTLLVLAGVTLLPLRSATALTYEITELGNLPGCHYAFPTAMNSQGTVVGYTSDIATGNARAFIWDKTTGMRDLGFLGEYSYANAINDSGQVVGYSSASHAFSRAFVWDAANGFRYLNIPGGGTSVAKDINNRGDIVGYTGFYEWGFVSTGDAVTLLSQGGLGASDAAAINESRTIAGTALQGHLGGLFEWDYTTPRGFLAFSYGGATDINESGLIAYIYSSSSFYGAVIDGQGNVVHYLAHAPGCNNSYVWGMDDAGVCVGESFPTGGPMHACLWDTSGHVQLLPTPFGGGSGAFAINNLGQVTGVYTGADGSSRAVIWTPVPEPSSVLALLCGAMGLVSLRRRR